MAFINSDLIFFTFIVLKIKGHSYIIHMIFTCLLKRIVMVIACLSFRQYIASILILEGVRSLDNSLVTNSFSGAGNLEIIVLYSFILGKINFKLKTSKNLESAFVLKLNILIWYEITLCVISFIAVDSHSHKLFFF